MPQETPSTILSIDDSIDNLEMMAFILQQAGYRVLTATDGREGLELAKLERPSLIISDVSMPVMNGIELCRRIRADEQLRSAPVMLVTAYRKDAQSVLEALQTGADDYVEAPYDPICLIAKVARLIERKRAEDALEQREKYYRTLIENSSDLISILDDDGFVQYVSPSLYHLLGYEPTSLFGQRVFNLIHAEDQKQAQRSFKEAFGISARPVEVELRFRHKDGSVRHFICKLTNLLEEPTIRGVLLNAYDITARKQMEQELRESEVRLRTVLNNAPVNIFTIDPQAVFTLSEGLALEAVGLKSGQLVGHSAYEVYRDLQLKEEGEQLNSTAQVINRVLRGEKVRGTIQLNDIYYDLSLLPLRSIEGEVLGAIGVSTDITAYKRTENALREHEELLGALLRNFPMGSVNIFDRDFRYLLAEGKGLQQTGLSSEVLTGKTIAELFPKKTVDYVLPFYERAFAGEEVEFELPLTDQIYSIRAAPLRDADDYVYAILAVAQNITERKRMEEGLRESEEGLKRAQRVAHIGSWDWDLLTNNVRWSDEMYRIYGVSREKFRLTLDAAFGLTHPDDLKLFNRALESLLEERIASNIDFRIIRPDGTIRIVNGQAEVYCDEEGRAVRMLGTVQDITERKLAEEEKEKLAAIVESSEDAIISKTLNGIVTSWNRGAEKIYGYSAHEMVGNPISVIIPRELQQEFSRIIEKIRHGESVSSFETERIGKDGRRLQVSLTISPITDSIGRLIGTSTIARDITERRRMEEKLKQQERQLAEAQQLAHIGSWNRDLKSDIITWSDEHFRMFGYKPQEFLPTYAAFLECVHPDDRPLIDQKSEEALRTLAPFSYNVRIVRRDGQVRTIHSRGEVVCDAEGKPVRMFGTAQDITELVRVQERLRASNNKLRALAARLESVREEEGLRIARELHDELGGAMTGLRWDLESIATLLSDVKIEPDRRRKLLSKMEDMDRLLDSSLMTVRRVSSELRPPLLDDIGLTAAIEWYAKQFEARTGIVCRVESTEGYKGLDRHQAISLYRIFQESLTNILRHAGASKVDLRLYRVKDELRLEIKDDGRGVSEEESMGTPSLGILGMRERAHLIGGEVTVTGAPGEGTVVVAAIPLGKVAE